jgi:hypothetical protein
MKLVALLVAGSFILVGCSTVPSAPAPHSVTAQPLQNTYWRGVDHDGPIVCHFRADHTIHYVCPSGNWTNGRWSQQNSEITFDYNNHFADQSGIVAFDHIVGTGSNIKGEKWTWWLVRIHGATPPKELKRKDLTNR